jgi:hypothetical protein
MYRHFDKQLTPHKFLEAEIHTERDVNPETWFDITLRWTTQVDHAGITLSFSFLKMVDVYVKLYDHRHWNEQTGTWHTESSWKKYLEDSDTPSFF